MESVDLVGVVMKYPITLEDLDMKKNIESMISFGGKERERVPSRVDTW